MRRPYRDRTKRHALDWIMDWSIPEPNSGCWIWLGSLNQGGYGSVGYHGKTHNAHRVSYSLAYGVAPEGLDLDHLCRVRCCVNPEHLEPVTRAENLRRGIGGRNLSAAALAKTNCPSGHPYAGANLFVDKRGRRDCRECRVRRTREWRAATRELSCEGTTP